MKKKSIFTQIIIIVAVAFFCIALTVGIALFAGSRSAVIFDFQNLNWANMLPILIFGGFISCIIIGITVIYVSHSIFLRLRDYFTENDKEDDIK